MSDSLHNLESELSKLNPKSVSAELEARIARDLEMSSDGLVFWPRTAWGWTRSALGAAAALLIVSIGLNHVWQPAVPQSPPGLLAGAGNTNMATLTAAAAPRHIAVKRSSRVPIAMESVLVSEDRTLPMFVSNNVPLQPVRRNYVDHTRWHDSEKGVSYTVTVPRQEIILVGIETN